MQRYHKSAEQEGSGHYPFVNPILTDAVQVAAGKWTRLLLLTERASFPSYGGSSALARPIRTLATWNARSRGYPTAASIWPRGLFKAAS